MAHFRQRGDTWCFTIDIGRDPITGSRKQKLVSKDDNGRPFKEERDARIYALKMEKDIERGKNFVSITFKAFIETYFDSQICIDVTESTHEYQTVIAKKYLIPALGRFKMDKINDLMIDDIYVKWLKEGMSRGMLRNISVVMSKTFRFARKKRFIVDNPMLLVKTPTYRPPAMMVFDSNQMISFLELAKDSRHYPSYVLALTSGMRLGEIHALTWDDINFETRTVTINKTLKWTKASGLHVKPHPKTKNSFRTIELPQSTLNILSEHKKKQMVGVNIVFDNLGEYYYPSTVSREFGQECIKHELPALHYHCMRHTHATLLLQPPNPIPVHVIAMRLGDTVETVMRTYAHVLPNAQEQVVQKINEMLEEKLPVLSQ
jgi:integrase